MEFTLAGLPPTPNQKMHWARKAKEAKKWRTASTWTSFSKWATSPIKKDGPLRSVKLTLIRASSAPVDSDNLIASFKNIIDGLKDAGIIADDGPNVVKEIKPWWTYAKRNAGYVKVIIEEC